MSKRFLSPNGKNPKELKKGNIKKQMEMTEEDKSKSLNNIKLFNKNEENIDDDNKSTSSYDSEKHGMETNRLRALENEIDYSNNCLITPFEGLEYDLDKYDMTETSSEDEIEEEDEYEIYLLDKKKR
jgi:hypothetical protein